MKSIYIPAIGYENVKTYKYAYDVTDRAITNTLMGWLWRLILHYLIPMWFSPNLITLLGLAILTVNWLTTIYFVPGLKSTWAEFPGWLILFNAFGVFMRQTLDAIDGKHARRTGSSSALGELLDHGLCDSLEIWYVGMMCCALGGFGVDYRLYIFLVAAMCSHYLEMWAIYLTGKLEFWYLSFQESELVGVIAHILVYIYGREPLEHDYTIMGYTQQYKEWIWWVCTAQFVSAAISGLVRGTYFSLFKAPKGKPTFTLLMPLAFILLFTSLWLWHSPALWVTPGLGVPMMTIFCTLVAYADMRLVVGRVCRFESSTYYVISFPLVLGFINAYLKGALFSEVTFVWIYLAAVIFAEIHAGYVITKTLCDHLNVNLLFIVPNPPKENPTH